MPKRPPQPQESPPRPGSPGHHRRHSLLPLAQQTLSPNNPFVPSITRNYGGEFLGRFFRRSCRNGRDSRAPTTIGQSGNSTQSRVNTGTTGNTSNGNGAKPRDDKDQAAPRQASSGNSEEQNVTDSQKQFVRSGLPGFQNPKSGSKKANGKEQNKEEGQKANKHEGKSGNNDEPPKVEPARVDEL